MAATLAITGHSGPISDSTRSQDLSWFFGLGTLLAASSRADRHPAATRVDREENRNAQSHTYGRAATVLAPGAGRHGGTGARACGGAARPGARHPQRAPSPFAPPHHGHQRNDAEGRDA